MMSKGLAILGCGGHARSIADVAISLGYSKICFIDDNAKPDEIIFGFPVLKSCEQLLMNEWCFFPGSGDNTKREQMVAYLITAGLQIATIVAPTATIGVGSILGVGTFIANHAHIGPLAKIDIGCIINTSAIVEHDVSIGCFTHVSVSSTLAGSTKIGNKCFIGANSTVIDCVSVVSNVIVGAGACVIYDIICEGVYVGIPAKRLNKC